MFAHDFHLKSIETQAEKIIRTIKLQFPVKETKIPGNIPNPAIFETMRKQSEDLDMYQELDFICFNRLLEIENNVLYLRD